LRLRAFIFRQTATLTPSKQHENAKPSAGAPTLGFIKF
jgi:hypothetical protein